MLDKKGSNRKGFQGQYLRFYIKNKQNKAEEARIQSLHDWLKPPPPPYPTPPHPTPPRLPNTSAFWTHLLLCDGQFSENRKAVEAAQLTPGSQSTKGEPVSEPSLSPIHSPTQPLTHPPTHPPTPALEERRFAISPTAAFKSGPESDAEKEAFGPASSVQIT